MVVVKGTAADWECGYLLLAGQWAAAAVQTKAAPSLCNYWTRSAGCPTLLSGCTRRSHPAAKQEERWGHGRWSSSTSWTQNHVPTEHKVSSDLPHLVMFPPLVHHNLHPVSWLWMTEFITVTLCPCQLVQLQWMEENAWQTSRTHDKRICICCNGKQRAHPVWAPGS